MSLRFVSAAFLARLKRTLSIFGALDPVQFAQVLLDFAFVAGSQFWDGRRTGPDFVFPVASLTKRQSGHLAKLVLQYSKDLRYVEPANGDMSHQTGVPQAVAVLDLNDVPHLGLESHAIRADVDLMVLVPILLNLLVILRTQQWSPAMAFIVVDFIGALILGPGTLTLIRRTPVHPAGLDSSSGCVVLMDDNFTVVIRGSQRMVEAVTEGGFYLSFADPQLARSVTPATEKWQEKQVISDLLYGILEGGCRGICEAIVMRLLHLHAAIPNLKEICNVVIFGRMIGKACWLGLKASVDDVEPPVSGITPLRSVARLTGELTGLLAVAACIASAPSATILLHSASFVVQSAYFGLFARLVLQSQNYRIRTERFLDALGRPSVRKWMFHTPASAATFVCLVLCRDIPRPVKSIDVTRFLNILIPDERDISRVWKARVADRIVHEESITFAPTIPTFRDVRQEHLQHLLDDAQSAYDRYCDFGSETSTSTA